MLLSHFVHIAEKNVTGILFAISCTAAIMYFGQPEIFDPLVMFVVITIALLFRHDRNLLSLLVLIAVVKITEEVTWLLFDNTLLVKVPLYLFMLAVISIFSGSWLRIYLFTFVGGAITTEVYWYSTGYDAPWIFWQVWMCTLMAFARRATALRVSWMMKLTNRFHYDFMKLDDHLYRVYTILIAFYSAITFEYYVRHHLGFHHITFIYYSVEYFTSLLASFVIYMIVVESFKHIEPSELEA